MCDSDGDDDVSLKISKLSEMLNTITVSRHYISVKSCSEKDLHSLISLQNKVYELIARKVKQTKLWFYINIKGKSGKVKW